VTDNSRKKHFHSGVIRDLG